MIKYNLKQFMARSQENVNDHLLFKVMEKIGLSPTGPWLAGGAVRRSLMGERLDSDFDVFFSCQEQMVSFGGRMEELGAKVLFSNDKQKTFLLPVGDQEVKLQLVYIAYYAGPEALLDSFDFTITQFATDGENLYCGDYSLWDLGRKKLALHKLTYGVATVRRLIKYARQGYTACSGVMADILERCVKEPEVIHRETDYID